MLVMQHLKDFDYTLPFDLIDTSELAKIIEEAKKPSSSLKCIHRNSALIRSIASHPSIISMVKEILGDTIYLWGSALIVAVPNHTHRYHVDSEHFHIPGVTVSIALKSNEENKFYFMKNSNSISIAPQEIQYNSIEHLEQIAKQYNEKASHVEHTMKDGQCIVWKGRVWHSTENKSNQTRLSLILQYAPSIPCIPTNYQDSRIPSSNTRFDGILINI